MKTKILLVDDDPNIRQLVNLYLKKEDYDVVLADRGDTALEKFKSDAPNLILLDLMLPGMDGWQVLREIRKTSNVPIIMLTAKDETFDKVLGLELGADDYVAKPFEPKELLKAVNDILSSDDKLEKMSAAMAKLAKPEATDMICDRIFSLLAENRK